MIPLNWRWLAVTGPSLHNHLCGEAGIRTLGTLAGTPVFKTGAIGRSATSPMLDFASFPSVSPVGSQAYDNRNDNQTLETAG